MDYSKIDWSRCELPEIDRPHAVDCSYGDVRVTLGDCAIAKKEHISGIWRYYTEGLTRIPVQWALKAAAAVDAFIAEEEKWVELESQPWLTPKELLIYLAKHKGPIRVRASNWANKEIEFEFGPVALVHRFPASSGDVSTETSLSWFMTANGNYRIVPQSQHTADVPGVQYGMCASPGKKWKPLLTVTGTHVNCNTFTDGKGKLTEVTQSFGGDTVSSGFVYKSNLTGKRVRLTLEVEE